MKSKTKTYVLLGLVLIIWGIVGYNIYSSVYGNVEVEPSFENKLNTSFKDRNLKLQNEYTIHSHQRDPFLGTLINDKPKKKIASQKRIVKENKPEIDIVYAGMIKTGNSKKEIIYFLRINGNRHLMHINDKISEVKLIQGNENQISVLVYGKRKVIKK